MKGSAESIAVSCTKDAAEAIRAELEAQGGGHQVKLTERKNLDGGTAAWIVIASLASQALPHILTFIKDFLGAKKVKRIKVGDWEVENPTPEMLQEFLAIRAARLKPEEKDVSG